MQMISSVSLQLATVGVLFVAVLPLSADAPDVQPRAAIHHNGHVRSDQELERILARAAEVELRRANLLAVSSHQLPSRGNGDIDIERVFAGYEVTDPLAVELLLIGNYDLSDDRLIIRYTLVDVTRLVVLSEVKHEGTIDLLFDRIVAQVVQLLVENSRDEIYAIRRQMRRVADAKVERVDRNPDADTVESVPVERRVPDQPGPSALTSARAEGRLELNVGGHAIVSIGEFAPYIPFGYSAGTTLLLWLSENSRRTGIGLSMGYQSLLSGTDRMAEFIRSFVPVGAELRFSPWRTEAISTHVFAVAGAAMRIDDGSVASQRLAAAIPYGAGGIAASFSVTGRLGVGARLGICSLFHIHREDPVSEPQVESLPGIMAGIYLYQLF